MNNNSSTKTELPQGVMLNAYPDSIGGTLSDIISMLKKPEFEGVFSLFYILPTFFNSDLDRGFSIIDYDINRELVTPEDVEDLEKLNIKLKFDLVLNHLSVGSPQFQDMLKNGDESEFKDFFIDWNDFWAENGEMGEDGYVIPKEEHLQKLFMRKPGLPILEVRFPDGSDRYYWNTFYQEVTYGALAASDRARIKELKKEEAKRILEHINEAASKDPSEYNLEGLAQVTKEELSRYTKDIIAIVEHNRGYLGQMDLNAKCEGVWDFYDDTLRKLRDYGATLIRLDAFAYLHKEPGEKNFFNKPGTWDYLERLRQIAEKYDLILLPEIHSEYGTKLHEEVAGEGFPVYDFFLPGLVIDAIDRGGNQYLLRWINEIQEKGIKTINMLGCHDGIPVLDLKGATVGGDYTDGLMTDDEIESVMGRIIDRGGRVKNLYGPDGKKISYYQVNATFFSALGEDEQNLRLARAIQLFMPGIPQVWYLDLFAGKNDYAAADKGGTGGHKEINRTALTLEDVDAGLENPIVRDQMAMIKLRNQSPAFNGELRVADTEEHRLELTWENEGCTAALQADLSDRSFTIVTTRDGKEEQRLSFR